MDYRLIVVVGSTPGAGKSTLSAFLARQLGLNGLKTQWLYEEDIFRLPVYRKFLDEILSQNPAFIESLLTATRQFVVERKDLDELLVTDSIFPCFNWLNSQGCAYEVMESFSRQLQPILDELNPLIIYLDAEVATAWQRAIGFRGTKYQDDTLEYMKTWPYYRDKEVTGLETILDYFQQNNELNLRLLAEWPNDKLLLNTSAQSLEECQNLILEKLNLTLQSDDFELPEVVLQKYVGLYKRVEEVRGIPQELDITIRNGKLRINTYWPDGCELVPTSEGRLELHNTSYYLLFETEDEFSYFTVERTGKYRRVG